jgi:hypothetical protein
VKITRFMKLRYRDSVAVCIVHNCSIDIRWDCFRLGLCSEEILGLWKEDKGVIIIHDSRSTCIVIP